MGLMPAYYTTTRLSRKSKKRKKTASQLKAEAEHAKFLKKVLGGSGRANASTLTDGARSSQANRAGGSIPLTSSHDHRSVAQPNLATPTNFIILPWLRKKKKFTLVTRSSVSRPCINQMQFRFVVRNRLKKSLR